MERELGVGREGVRRREGEGRREGVGVGVGEKVKDGRE